VADFFQRFIDPEGTLLDLGAGFCWFINPVRARHRLAMDANPAVREAADPEVKAIVSSDLSLPMIADGELTQVFMSNFLEHMTSAASIIDLMATLHRKIRKGGSVLILQPNFRYVGAAYFDFIDHQVVLTDRSLVEVLETSGFRVTYMKKRFLPYTSKSRLPKWPWLVQLYVRCPPLHWLCGQQTFVVAEAV
jgi:hypothetical protein